MAATKRKKMKTFLKKMNKRKRKKKRRMRMRKRTMTLVMENLKKLIQPQPNSKLR